MRRLAPLATLRLSPVLGAAIAAFCVLGQAAVVRSQAQAVPATPPASAAPLPTPASDSEIEQFLLKGEVRRTRGVGKGITGSLRATMEFGSLTHDAHIQIIDEQKREFRSTQGTEFNFRDSWEFNIAAYKVDRLLGFRLVPVSVERRFRNNRAAYTWWIDDVQMDEGERLKKKLNAPDPVLWNEEMQLVRLFDQLIANTDRNLGNLVITNAWTIWAIDHTRAFRTSDTLKTPGNIARCDRAIFERLKALDKATLKREVGSYLQNWEIDALLKRRDAIVTMIEGRGPAGLFDRRRDKQAKP
jgi:hypothetical protein